VCDPTCPTDPDCAHGSPDAGPTASPDGGIPDNQPDGGNADNGNQMGGCCSSAGTGGASGAFLLVGFVALGIRRRRL
jgi:MYXO-CTERM domain-containing protein